MKNTKKSRPKHYSPGNLSPDHAGFESLSFYDQRMLLKKTKENGAFGDKDLDFPDWLVSGSNFNSNVWHCCFGQASSSIRITVDFRIELYDSSLLTDDKNSTLLRGIKTFLAIQIHPKYNRNRRKSGGAEANRFRLGMKFTDHLLMNGERLGLITSGFNLIRSVDLTDYLINKTGNPASSCLYDYPSKLESFLKRAASGISESQISEAELIFENLRDLPPTSDRKLLLTDDELIKARTYIVINNFFSRQFRMVKYNSSEFLYFFYRNTLAGRSLVPPTFDELNEGIACNSEFPAVPVRNETTRPPSKRVISLHLKVVRSLRLAQELVPGLKFNSNVCVNLSLSSILKKVGPKPLGRYRSVPGEVVFNLIRDSYDYIFRFKALIMPLVAKLAGTSHGDIRLQYISLDSAAKIIIDSELQVLGGDYKHWLIPYSTQSPAYHPFLRQNQALFNSYLILMGSYLVIIGALTARRQTELLTAASETCLYPDVNPYDPANLSVEYELGFMAGKTGNRHAKEFLTVPIPALVAKLLWDLKVFHSVFVREGLMPADMPLFFYVGANNVTAKPMSPSTYNSCLTAICDYSQTPTIELNGRVHRFYVRQHQFRRFFAMVFFASAGFKDLDALRAFMGHSDIQHLYTYIVEITPGAMLQEVKARTLTEAALAEYPTIENINVLKRFLCEVNNVHDLTLKDVSSLKSILRRASASCDEQLRSDMPILSEINVYDNLEYLLTLRLIDLQPDFVRVEDDQGIRQDVHLIVKLKL
ncbi:hypothetical protein [Pseudomonas sp.]|uniref:hypothetical protein n=1 Tax=Pseudomonas sp. TaxID=306 RepID=UPI0028B124AF|nr:hypothetical protein [Pseudomonas sp.]